MTPLALQRYKMSLTSSQRLKDLKKANCHL